MNQELAFAKPHRERLEPEVYEELKQKVFQRDQWTCRNPTCQSGRNLQVHHLKKRSQLGGDEIGNLVTLCILCHDLVEANQLKIEVVDVVVKFHERKEAKDEKEKKPENESGGVPA